MADAPPRFPYRQRRIIALRRAGSVDPAVADYILFEAGSPLLALVPYIGVVHATHSWSSLM